MICPFCSGKTRIYNSRSTHSKTQTWRRHRCEVCKNAFTTKEKIEWTDAVSIYTGEDRSPYSRERLLLSINRASTNLSLPTGMISELTDSVELELQQNGYFGQKKPAKQTISETTITILGRYSPHLALQYINQIYANKPPLELIKSVIAL